MDIPKLGDGSEVANETDTKLGIDESKKLSRRERLGDEAYARVMAKESKYRRANKKKRSLCSMATRKKKPEFYKKRMAEWRQNNREHLRDTYKEFRAKNKVRLGDKRREFYRANSESVLAAQRMYKTRRHDAHVRAWKLKRWNEQNKEHSAKRNSAYVKRNRPRINKRQCEYIKNRCAVDLDYKLRCRLRGRIWSALKDQSAKKSARAQELLGCDMEHFRNHLQSKFTPEMNWENYGSYWHVDHIRPLASFNLTNPEEQKAAFHYTNCQPLEGKENIRKSDNFTP